MIRYLIIGGGIAGTTVAEEIRKHDTDSEITIIEHEQHRCYSRVLLAHYVRQIVERDRVFIKKEEWYEQKNIELQTGVRALAIDTKNKFVRTSEERELPYDKLIITTGGELNLLGEDLRGVSYLRTLDDADNLKQLIAEMGDLPKKERRGIVYGGGFIALEYINIFAKFNIHTTVVMRSSGFWSRALSETSQKVLADQAKESGIDLETDVSSVEFLGDKEFAGLRLASGKELSAKILGVGIGVKFDNSIFDGTDIEFKNGIVVNEYLETSLPDVYAAGDIVEFYDVIAGRRLRLGNWMSALMQARALGKTLTGDRTQFELVSSYSIDLQGMDVVFIGDTSRPDADEVIQRVAEPNKSVEVFIRDGSVVGAVMIGDVSQRSEITRAIKEKKMLK